MSKNLIEVLRKIEESLEGLLNAANLKQRALIEQKAEALESAISKEEISVSRLNHSGKQLVNTIKELYSPNNNNSKMTVLEEFISFIEGKLDKTSLEIIKTQQKKIRTVTEEISVVNIQNKILTEHSKHFIREMLSKFNDFKKIAYLDKKV